MKKEGPAHSNYMHMRVIRGNMVSVYGGASPPEKLQQKPHRKNFYVGSYFVQKKEQFAYRKRARIIAGCQYFLANICAVPRENRVMWHRVHNLFTV